MRSARRDRVISAAQVAKHYGGYTLQTAMELSREEREVLLGVHLADREDQFERLERVLGTLWDLEPLLATPSTKEQERAGSTQLPAQVRLPLVAALAPDMLDFLSKRLQQRARTLMEQLAEVDTGSTLVNIGSLSTEQAKALWKHIASRSPPVEE